MTPPAVTISLPGDLLGQTFQQALADALADALAAQVDQVALLTPEETCALLKIGDRKLARITGTGKLRRFVIGPRIVRYRLADVKAFLEASAL